MKVTVKAGGSYELIEPGIYHGKVLRYEDAGEGAYGPQLKWSWALMDGPESLDSFPTWTGQVLSMDDRCKLLQLVKAVTNKAEFGEDFDLDECLDGEAILNIGIRKKKSDPTQDQNYLISIAPVRRKRETVAAGNGAAKARPF